YQADRSLAWRPELGTLVETLWLAGHLSPGQIDLYVRHAIDPKIHVRPLVQAGDPVPVVLELRSRVATSSILVATGISEGMRISDQSLGLVVRYISVHLSSGATPGPPSGFDEFDLLSRSNRAEGIAAPDPVAVPLGKHTLRTRWSFM